MVFKNPKVVMKYTLRYLPDFKEDEAKDEVKWPIQRVHVLIWITLKYESLQSRELI